MTEKKPWRGFTLTADLTHGEALVMVFEERIGRRAIIGQLVMSTASWQEFKQDALRVGWRVFEGAPS